MTPKEQWKLAWTLARMALRDYEYEQVRVPYNRMSKPMRAAVVGVFSAKPDILATHHRLRIYDMLRRKIDRVSGEYLRSYNCRCIAVWVLPQ